MRRPGVLLLAAGAGAALAGIAYVTSSPSAVATWAATGPEKTVVKCIQAFNRKDIRSFLSTVDPAKENLILQLVDALQKEENISLEQLQILLPGLIQVLGNPLPDDWRLDNVKVIGRKTDDDLAWLTISGTLTTRVRDLRQKEFKQMKFSLHDFDNGIGWRIVDFKMEVAGMVPQAESPKN